MDVWLSKYNDLVPQKKHHSYRVHTEPEHWKNFQIQTFTCRVCMREKSKKSNDQNIQDGSDIYRPDTKKHQSRLLKIGGDQSTINQFVTSGLKLTKLLK